MSGQRDSALDALLEQCGKPYGGAFTRENDLPSVQTIDQYQVDDNQLKYVHMYFAKYAGLWGRVRSLVGHDDKVAMWSIGAGPLLNLFGWFWEAPCASRNVVAIDAIPWGYVRSLEPFQRLTTLLVDGLTYRPGLAFPEPLGQCAVIAGLQPQLAAEIPEGSTVLMPFILNHLLGVKDGVDAAGEARIAEWFRQARARARIVVADMPSDVAAVPWQRIMTCLGAPGLTPGVLTFSDAAARFSPFYKDGQGRRRSNDKMCRASVVLVEPDQVRDLA